MHGPHTPRHATPVGRVLLLPRRACGGRAETKRGGVEENTVSRTRVWYTSIQRSGRKTNAGAAVPGGGCATHRPPLAKQPPPPLPKKERKNRNGSTRQPPHTPTASHRTRARGGAARHARGRTVTAGEEKKKRGTQQHAHPHIPTPRTRQGSENEHRRKRQRTPATTGGARQGSPPVPHRAAGWCRPPKTRAIITMCNQPTSLPPPLPIPTLERPRVGARTPGGGLSS